MTMAGKEKLTAELTGTFFGHKKDLKLSLAWPPSSDTAPTQSIHGRPLSASAGCSEPCSSAIIACRLHTSEPRCGQLRIPCSRARA